MKRSILVPALVLLSLLVPQAAWGIVYGEPDNGRHPNVAAVIGEQTDPRTGKSVFFPLCTGTLIDADVVLSASHCFTGLPIDVANFYVSFDEVVDGNGNGVVDRGVELLSGDPVTHPRFGTGGQNNSYDIAVFLLDEAATDITPAELPEAGMLRDRSLRGRTFVAVGYGAVRESNRQGPQGIVAGGKRRMARQHINSVTKAWVTFSMNRATGNGGTCYGDSGGPHFLGDVVVAVTVTGDRQCKATDKSYRLDTAYARNFLARFVTLP